MCGLRTQSRLPKQSSPGLWMIRLIGSSFQSGAETYRQGVFVDKLWHQFHIQLMKTFDDLAYQSGKQRTNNLIKNFKSHYKSVSKQFTKEIFANENRCFDKKTYAAFKGAVNANLSQALQQFEHDIISAFEEEVKIYNRRFYFVENRLNLQNRIKTVEIKKVRSKSL